MREGPEGALEVRRQRFRALFTMTPHYRGVIEAPRPCSLMEFEAEDETAARGYVQMVAEEYGLKLHELLVRHPLTRSWHEVDV